MLSICNNCKQENPNKKCSACHQVTYCSKDCQEADWKTHKKVCAKPRKACLIDGDQLIEQDLTVSEIELDDRNAWVICKIPTLLLGFYVLVKRLEQSSQSQTKEISSVFMMDPSTGKAPREWQSACEQKLLFTSGRSCKHALMRGAKKRNAAPVVNAYVFWNLYDFINDLKEFYSEGKSQIIQRKLLNPQAYNMVNCIKVQLEGHFRLKDNFEIMINTENGELPETVIHSESINLPYPHVFSSS